MRHPRHPSIAGPVLVAAALIVLAACGGSSSKKAATGDATTTANGAGSTIKATKGGDFCKQIAATYNDSLAFSQAGTRSPDDLRRLVEKALKDGQNIIDDAPTEVKADLQIIEDTVKRYADALAKVNYDATRLGPEAATVLATFNTPQFQQAATHSQQYSKDHCGIDVNTGSGPTTSAP